MANSDQKLNWRTPDELDEASPYEVKHFSMNNSEKKLDSAQRKRKELIKIAFKSPSYTTGRQTRKAIKQVKVSPKKPKREGL